LLTFGTLYKGRLQAFAENCALISSGLRNKLNQMVFPPGLHFTWWRRPLSLPFLVFPARQKYIVPQLVQEFNITDIIFRSIASSLRQRFYLIQRLLGK
jgi:hypothetical protein